MKTTKPAAPIALLVSAALLASAGVSGCASPDRTQSLRAKLGESPFRVTEPAVQPTGADDTILIRYWSLECLDPAAPEVQTLCGRAPYDGGGRAELPTADQIADQLDALDARGLIRLRAMPSLAIMSGETGEIRTTQAVNRPDLQQGVTPGDSLFPFELGERFRVGAAFDADGSISLDIDYRLETADEPLDESAPQVMTTAIRTAVRLESGQSVVLGGQRLLREVSTRRTPEQSVLLVVVNARAVPKPPERRADAG
jgi:Flp pilus assembly secretin CpaC